MILLEHEPVYTIGRLLDKSSLAPLSNSPIRSSKPTEAARRPITAPVNWSAIRFLICACGAGICIVILRKLEDLLIDLLKEFEIKGDKIAGKTGVWVRDRKIASIGVGVRKWVTMHGFALNVANDLSGFQNIIPCGLPGVRMTSISAELGKEVSLETVREKISPYLRRYLREAFQWQAVLQCRDVSTRNLIRISSLFSCSYQMLCKKHRQDRREVPRTFRCSSTDTDTGTTLRSIDQREEPECCRARW